MSVAWVDGAFCPAREARISIFDRGLLFADAVYEVAAVLGGGLVDIDAHLARLARSAEAIGMRLPASTAELRGVCAELAARAALDEGLVYLQVTRGAPASRGFVADPGARPTAFAFTELLPISTSARARDGARVVTAEDRRWAGRHIKTTGLLAQALARTFASERGAGEAWLVDDGVVTEGAASSAFILEGRRLRTAPLDAGILAGTTRARILAIADELGLGRDERAFTPAEARAADEAFYTGAAAFVVPVVAIDDTPIRDEKPGPFTRALQQRYLAWARDDAAAELRARPGQQRAGA